MFSSQLSIRNAYSREDLDFFGFDFETFRKNSVFFWLVKFSASDWHSPLPHRLRLETNFLDDCQAIILFFKISFLSLKLLSYRGRSRTVRFFFRVFHIYCVLAKMAKKLFLNVILAFFIKTSYREGISYLPTR